MPSQTSRQTKPLAPALAATALLAIVGCASKSNAPASPRPSVSDAERRYLEADDRLFEDPYDAEALVERAAALREMNQPAAAAEDAQLALVRDPDNAEARALLDELATPAAPIAQAEPEPEPELEPVLEPEPEPIAAAPEPDPEPEVAPEPQPDPLELAMARARGAINAPDYFLALAALDDALEAQPGYAPAIELKGWVYNQQQRYSDAIRELASVENRSPDARMTYAYACLRNQDYTTAVTELDTLIDAEGPTPLRLMYRGLSHLYAGDNALAADDLSAALDTAPADWEHAEYAARLLERAGG